MSRSRLGLLVLALACSPSALARAEVTLPNGDSVPHDGYGDEINLNELFACSDAVVADWAQCQVEAIDWVADAYDEPNTFSPLCDFTATLVLNQTGSTFGVGWYNVDPNATTAPAIGDIHVVIEATDNPGDAVGMTVTGASIRNDPNYAGGLIGFALLTSHGPHYTEKKWNTVCNKGDCAATPGPWILSLTYRSTVTPNAFYLAFEDGAQSDSGWDNDGDYNDYVFFFTGLTCQGAGEPCDVPGAEGICAQGLTDCDGASITCKSVNEMTDEVCDGLDNDCDGAVDEDDTLCGASQVCSQGQCIDACDNEFGCIFNASYICVEGYCVDPDCADVSCDAGEVCRDGTCMGPCEGIVCPGDQVCRIGRCVDPCDGVVCGDGLVCTGGACVPTCDCNGCAADLACDASDGACREPACVDMTCGPGTVCRAGSCVDACDGAVCPGAEVCYQGECVDPSTVDGGVGAGGGSGNGAGGGNGNGAGGGNGNGTGGGTGAGGGSGGGKAGSSGCGCSLPGGATSGSAPLSLGLALGVLAALRRRRS